MRSQAPANRAASVRQRLLNIAKERGEDFNFEAAGIMATFDGGNSWMTIPGSDTVGAITAFAFDEVQAQVYISSYGRGLWRMGWCGPTTTPAPQFTFVPPDITTYNCGTVDLGTARAVDVCGPNAVTITNNAPAKLLPGTTTITWTARNSAGATVTATQQVTLILADDPACCPAGTNIILGTQNNDTLTGTAGPDCILGFGQQDTINGMGGVDYISGGGGDDILNGGAGNDVIFGGNGQDQISGDADNDVLFGNEGDGRSTAATVTTSSTADRVRINCSETTVMTSCSAKMASIP